MLRDVRLGSALLFLAAVGCAPREPVTTPPAPHTPPPHVAGAALESAADIGDESSSAVTFERIAKFPEPGWRIPRKIHFSPDGKLVTYLASETGDEKMSLHVLDLATRAEKVLLRAADLDGSGTKLSKEEELRRERQRTRIEGITDYRWAETKNVLVVPHKNGLTVRNAAGGLVHVDGPAIDPQPCPTGERVAFVRDGGLVVVDASTAKETWSTRTKVEGVTRGLSDFNAQEELDEPSGFWWAPDCKRIAYLEVDERGVESIPIVGYRKDASAERMDQRYPRTGKPNPKVSLHIVDTQSRVDRPITLPDEAGNDPYIVRFGWSKDGKSLFFQALPRSQKERRLLRADAATGKVEAFAGVGTTDGWIDPSPFRVTSRGVIWLERRGVHMHAVMHSPSGGGATVLTQGDFDVFDLEAVSPDEKTLFVTTNRDGVLGRQLEAIPIVEGKAIGVPKNLTPGGAFHETVVSPKADAFVDTSSSTVVAPTTAVRWLDGKELPFGTATDAEIAALGIRPPEIVSTTVDGTKLYGLLLKPRRVAIGRRYPLILVVYGGPGAQMVQNKFAPHLLWQHLADRGFFVAQFDNRGTAGRGPAFEEPIAGSLGRVELSDQLAALNDLLDKQPDIDPARVGIYGHSYGGFLAVRAMLDSPKTFRAAAAGSPVTDWRLYDSAYTERYMGSPSSNQAGYDASSLLPKAGALQGKLMLLHGLMDENVHFENMGKLLDAFVTAGKTFDLVLFPAERHGYRGPNARAYANRRVADFFVRELGPGERAATP